MTLIGRIPESSHKFYHSDNLKNLEPYVTELINMGMPLWMVEHERSAFRTAQDTGANEGYLRCWNVVRQYHGFPPLTVNELWQRHADSNNWTDEYRDFNKYWMPIWWESYDTNRNNLSAVIKIPEFKGKKVKG